MSKNCWISSGSLISVDTGCDVINASLTITGKMSSTTWRANCKYSNSQQISRICFFPFDTKQDTERQCVNAYDEQPNSPQFILLHRSQDGGDGGQILECENCEARFDNFFLLPALCLFVCLFVCFFFSFLSADQLACTNATRVGYGQSTLD